MNLADKCRTVAAYHGSTTLMAHVQHLEDVVQLQRAALLEAADRIEELESQAASHKASHASMEPVTHATASSQVQGTKSSAVPAVR